MLLNNQPTNDGMAFSETIIRGLSQQVVDLDQRVAALGTKANLILWELGLLAIPVALVLSSQLINLWTS